MIVTKAWNGREAVEIFENSEPGYFDVILMDLMMPKMGGLEATRRIRKMDREDAKSIPIEYCNNNFPTGFVSKTCDALILDITLYPPSIKIKHLLMEWS